MTKSLLAVLAVAIVTLISSPSTADDLFCQNLSVFSLSPHTDRPEIFFANDGWVTKIRQVRGEMYFHTDSDDIPFPAGSRMKFNLPPGPMVTIPVFLIENSLPPEPKRLIRKPSALFV